MINVLVPLPHSYNGGTYYDSNGSGQQLLTVGLNSYGYASPMMVERCR